MADKLRNTYAELLVKMKDISCLASIQALLGWDQRTYIPPNGHAHRSEQLAFLAGEIHRRAVSPEIGEMLAGIEHSELTADPNCAEAVNIRNWRRDYDRSVKVPQELAVALARAASDGQTAWEKARADNDWETFRPYLENNLSLKKEEAQAIGYETEPYDVLLDEFEPGETAANLEIFFKGLIPALSGVLDKIGRGKRKPDAGILRRDFPVDVQEAFCRETIALLGYDFNSGRLDKTTHPFATDIGPGDVRITNRYNPAYFGDAFFGAIHETGHALYEMGLPPEHWGTPSGQAASYGVHESQSRLWENFVARSEGFWRYFFPRVRERFPVLKDVSPEDFTLAVNEVRPDFIRVEADEVTYNFHVALRFELELGLFRGEIDVALLPEVWNGKMKSYLGIIPPDYSKGVLQDVHWSFAAFGYFPSYTMGNVYASMFYAKAEEELGDMNEMFARGDFRPLLEWLGNRIHSRGRRYDPRELVKTVCGKEPDYNDMIAYLLNKYAGLYAF